MESSQNVWNDFLHAASKDEAKREANLVILGDSKSSCLSIVDAVLDNLGQPLNKKRDIDIINYSYATVGYLNRRINSGDYLGVLHITILCDITFGELLLDSLQRIDPSDLMFLIALDFRDTANLMDYAHKWINFATDITVKLLQNNPKISLESMKSNWEKRVLSISQELQKQITTEQESVDPTSNPLLPRGLLTTNIGVPLFLVCSHTEFITQLKQLNEIRLDFIQYSLRRLCLEYGSSLAYFNTTKRNMIPMITSNILAILFMQQYSVPSTNMVARDELFIPVGADNVFLIDDLLIGTKLDSVTDFNSVIERPTIVNKKASIQSQRILTEEEFFSSLVGNDENASPLPRKSRRTPLQSKPRVSIQAQSLSPPSGSPVPRVSSSGDMTTRNFFENLINGGNTTPTVVPRKSINVGRLRKGDNSGKK